MVKIYQRPDPPPPDVDSNRAVRRTDTFLNREASAGLFQKALVKAEGQDNAVEQSKQAESGLEQQMESDADSVFGAKARESLQDVYSDNKLNRQNSEHSNAEVADKAELQEASDEVESSDVDSADEHEIDKLEDDKQDTESASSAESTAGIDSTAAYQMFDNIRDSNSSNEAQPHANINVASEGVNDEQSASVNAQVSVAQAASTGASLESRVDSLSSLSGLIDMLESSSNLPDGNEWTLILEDDGPVSELTLSSDTEGRWNIDLRTSFDNQAVDDEMIGSLRNQLDTAGIAVANIALVDNKLVDKGVVDSAPTDVPSSGQMGAMPSSTNSHV